MLSQQMIDSAISQLLINLFVVDQRHIVESGTEKRVLNQMKQLIMRILLTFHLLVTDTSRSNHISIS